MEPRDLEIIYRWENDPENWLVSNTIAPFSKQQIQDFILAGNDLYAQRQMRLMIETLEGETAGCMDLFDFDPKNHRCGIGVLMDGAFRGRGFAKEALKITVRYCFDVLELHSLFANIPEDNEGSIRLFAGAGFVLQGTKKSWLWDGSGYKNEYFYQLIRE